MVNRLSARAQRWLLRRVDVVARRTGRLRGRPEHLLVGERGEMEALFYLREQGYTIVGRRWRTGRLRGDLDLIGWEGGTLCFAEVKTRTERSATDPAEAAVDREKRRMLRAMGAAYLRGFPEARRRGVLTRFDVVSVYLGGAGAKGSGRRSGAVGNSVHCELLRGAFGWRE